MRYEPLTPRADVAPERIAPDTYVVHQVQDALGKPLSVYLNSMVISGAEPVLVDTGTIANRDQWLADTFSIVDPVDVRWIYLSHDDVDHTGNLLEAMELCPHATLVCSWAMVERHTNAFAFPLERCRWVDDGDTIDLGDRQLRVVMPPVWDSPTSKGVFDERTGVYWAVDAFALSNARRASVVRRRPRQGVLGARHDDVRPSRAGAMAGARRRRPLRVVVRPDRAPADHDHCVRARAAHHARSRGGGLRHHAPTARRRAAAGADRRRSEVDAGLCGRMREETTTMNDTIVHVHSIPAVTYDEWMHLAETELHRLVAALEPLTADEWAAPTPCSDWTVRDMVGHLLGMMELGADRAELQRQVGHAAERLQEHGGYRIDHLTALQVVEHAALTTAQLLDALRGDDAARARRPRRVDRGGASDSVRPRSAVHGDVDTRAPLRLHSHAGSLAAPYRRPHHGHGPQPAPHRRP